MKVLLCGGGNAIHVLTSLIGALDDCEVYILSLYEDEAERLEKAISNNAKSVKGIKCITDLSDEAIYGKPIKISNRPEEVVPGSDVILLSIPAFTHELYLKAMAPYIDKPRCIVGSLPAEGGFDMCVREAFGPELTNKCVMFATETLPWACRIQTFGEVVEILGTKKDIDISVSPLQETTTVTDLLSRFFGRLPRISSAGSFLSVTLMNINSVWHPTITYGRYRNWDCKSPLPDRPLFYQGSDEYTGEKLELVSDEVLAIKDALLTKYPKLDLTGVRHVRDWMPRAYGKDIGDTSSVYRMLQTNKGYRGLLHPMTTVQLEDGSTAYMPDFKYRYMTEDIPCGLIVTRGIAELLGVNTPHIDEILLWASARCDKSYLVDGKLTGPDIKETRCPQRYGFHTLDNFMTSNHYLS